MGPLSGARRSDTYFEVSLSGKESPSAEENARRFFLSKKIPARQLARSGLVGRFRMSYYARTRADGEILRRAFERLPVKGLRFSLRRLGPRDWRDRWQKYFHVRNLGNRFTVVPWREKMKFKRGRRIPLYLDPEGAFGTGFHETTRLTLGLMERLAGRFDTFLDLGTGTGILGVAAGRLGARGIQAVEKHGPSLKTARKNFRLNGIRADRCFYGGLEKFRAGRRFDLVCANLISSTLLAHRARISGWVKKGKYLAVSGLLRKEKERFLDLFARGTLRLLEERAGRKWTAFLFRRS